MNDKAPDAYRTISEVAEDLDLPQHVLRFWETRFTQIKPLKRGGGRRYYRPDDVDLLKGIRHLLYAEGYTIKGVQRILKEQGPKSVMAVGQGQAQDFGAASDSDHGEEDVYDIDDMPAPEPARPAPAPYPPAARPVAPAAQPMAPRMEPPLHPPPAAYARPAAPAAPEWPSADLPPVYHPQPPVYVPPARAADAYAPPPRVPELPSYPDYAPEPAAPAPVPAPERPRTPPTVSYMRGGLSNPLMNRKPVIPAAPPPPEPPVTGQTFNVRRAPAAAAEPPVARFAPLPMEEPEFVEGAHLAPAPVAARHGLSDESRRALQSALFELTECRRAIERITATRDR